MYGAGARWNGGQQPSQVQPQELRLLAEYAGVKKNLRVAQGGQFRLEVQTTRRAEINEPGGRGGTRTK